MKELIKPCSDSISSHILAHMENEGICFECLSTKDLVDLLRLQAKRDDSNDKPILKSSAFNFSEKGINFVLEYSVSEGLNEKTRLDLRLSGLLVNGSNGLISEEEKVAIEPNDDILQKRVYEAFDTENSLPVKAFFKSMIEDALRPDVEITGMNLIKDKLSIVVKNNSDRR
jgi:hypothetical protein